MMKKIICITSIFLVISTFTIKRVAADTIAYLYEATVQSRKTGYTVYETARSNYVYTLNMLTNSSGRATIHSYYQTKYNGRDVTVGEELVLDGAGNIGTSLWKPTGVNSNPSGFNITNRKNCIGNNVTSNYCVIEGSKYRLKLENQNWLYHFNIRGQFIFSN